jgi:hypothetical protein
MSYFYYYCNEKRGAKLLFFLYFCGLIWKNTIETGCFREYNYTMFSTQQSINAKSP